MAQRRSTAFWFVIFGAILATATGAAASEYALSGTAAVDTPTRTVNFEGQQYTINAVSRISADDSVTITATAPADASYDLQLRGPENELIDTVEYSGDATHTFEYFGPGDAGTYAVTIRDDGNTVAVYPIVIAGYDISVPQPADISAGSNARISATVTERSVALHSSLDRVQVIVGNDTATRQAIMTEVDVDTYETTVDTDALAPGTYSVYVVARGDETVREADEILGVSDTVSLDITTDGMATEVGDEEHTESNMSSATSDSAEATSPTAKRTDDIIIEPTTPTTRTTTGGSGPGFSLLAGSGVVLGLCAVAGWWRRR